MAKTTEYHKQLGEKISKIREGLGLSQKKVAQTIDIPQSMLSKFETQGEKLPADKINEMLDLMGYELDVVEKKKQVERLPLKQRLQQLLQAAEDVVARMNNDSGKVFDESLLESLRAPAPGQHGQQEAYEGDEA